MVKKTFFFSFLLPSVDLQEGVGRRRVVGRDEREVGLGEVLFLFLFFGEGRGRGFEGVSKGKEKEAEKKARHRRAAETAPPLFLLLPLSLPRCCSLISLCAATGAPDEDTHLARTVDDG